MLHIKQPLFSSMVIALFACGSADCGTISFDYIDCFSYIGPFQMDQNGDWFSADILIARTPQGARVFEELEVVTGFLNLIDAFARPYPPLLAWAHDKYFVTVYEERAVTFSVLYRDAYGNDPLPGYPRVVYWGENQSAAVSASLDYAGPLDSDNLYRRDIVLPPGRYRYMYLTRNAQFPVEYSLESGSFTVTQRPIYRDNGQVLDRKTVSNGTVVLRWNAEDPGGAGLVYRLYLGRSPENMPLVYEGREPRHQMHSLAYRADYYWQVESINIDGISTRSPLYSFSTIAPATRAFNYPNPFNPSRDEHTNIVFDMEENGSAQISVYTEFGDLCWRERYNDLAQGANEVAYHGRDADGELLYNGTYMCTIKKNYAQKEAKDTCRILVIK